MNSSDLKRQGPAEKSCLFIFPISPTNTCDLQNVYEYLFPNPIVDLYRWKHIYLQKKQRIEHFRQLRIFFIGVCKSYPHREKLPHIEPLIFAKLSGMLLRRKMTCCFARIMKLINLVFQDVIL